MHAHTYMPIIVQWNLAQWSLSKAVSLLITGSMQDPKIFANTHSTLIHSLNGHLLLWIAARPAVPIASHSQLQRYAITSSFQSDIEILCVSPLIRNLTSILSCNGVWIAGQKPLIETYVLITSVAIHAVFLGTGDRYNEVSLYMYPKYLQF